MEINTLVALVEDRCLSADICRSVCSHFDGTVLQSCLQLFFFPPSESFMTGYQAAVRKGPCMILHPFASTLVLVMLMNAAQMFGSRQYSKMAFPLFFPPQSLI